MKDVLSMKTGIQKIDGPTLHAYLKRARSPPNIICSYLAVYRLYHSLYNDLVANRLFCFKNYLIKHYGASIMDNQVCGINRYLDFLEEICSNRMIRFRLTIIRTQQVAFLDNVVSQKDYETFRKRLKGNGNMLRYSVARFLACTGAGVSGLIQIKAGRLHLGCINLYTKGDKVHRLHFPDALCQEILEWLSVRDQVSGFLFISHGGNQTTARGISNQPKTPTIRCNIPPGTVYPYSLRHRFVKNFLESFNRFPIVSLDALICRYSP